jgi:serine/threonine protein kinase
VATDSSQTSLRESLLPGRYRVLEQIAVGGMASIWLAEDRVLGRQVAVKVLAEQLASQPLFVTRFEREARTAAALSGHPNLITIYDVGEHEERPFIVMEHLPGGTLRDRIGAGPVDRSEMLEWLRQAASALDFANQRDVVHRDVKPQNLLFDGSGRLVVADLGIARAAYEDSLTASGELIGTASYISPEQAMGDPATPASDRYSLAVVAYELLTGARPFAGGSFAEQAIQQIESEPDPPSARACGLGAEVDRVLLKGLAKDPAARWPTASAFVSALAQALERPAPRPEVATAPLIDPERSWPRQAEPFPTRHGRSPARLAAVAAVVVALAVVAGVVAFGTGGDGGSPNRAKATKHRNAQAKSEAAEPSTTTPTTTAPAPAPPGAPSSGSGAAMNEQGYALMRAGRYDQAAPVLQRAVAAFGQSSTELTYAYALYNLGRSLRLSGRPAEAIPYLERRMRFPNQRDVVRRELAAARAATG